MNIRMAQPQDRIDQTFFDIGSDTKNHQISIAHYICPSCDETFRFTSRNLVRRFFAKTSNLKAECSEAFDRARPLGAWEGFLDFYCAGCCSPVRIIYGHAGEFAMSAYNFKLIIVLETITADSV
jgi:hypothetical protein